MEIVLFGISITYWLRSLAGEREKALKTSVAAADEIVLIKQNQNILLEREVNVKTLELKLANQQLEESYKKIESLNRYLEKDNGQLKVLVSDQIKARSEDKLMSFEEFKQNFPDEETCYKHIENIKWANGFVCTKCGATSYYDKKIVNNKPAKKCTKCGFVNTLTSYTLYHNVKFPIQKAFYITYVIGTKKTKTLEDFSLELDTRSATVHAFIQKVKEASSAITRRKHKDGWTHLIQYYKTPQINGSDNSGEN
jgi:predicted RNA-binding Zn-ribbon protein involved in translation (DUF1610 family)